MDAGRKHAYRVVLAAGCLHVKGDLACLYGGFSWLPWRSRYQARNAHRAACRSFAFHNLAIFSAEDFSEFSEEYFWRDIDKFLRDFPETRWSNYRGMFEHALLGKPVHIIAPGGGVPFSVSHADGP